jgi:hypothetical protein
MLFLLPTTGIVADAICVGNRLAAGADETIGFGQACGLTFQS